MVKSFAKKRESEGLTLGVFLLFNKALLGQQSQRYVSKGETFLKQVIKEKYGEEEGG